jgi:hypothetical protein
MANITMMLPTGILESAFQTQSQPLSEPHQASQVWSKPPKILASTATIRRAGTQVGSLFARELRQLYVGLMTLRPASQP